MDVQNAVMEYIEKEFLARRDFRQIAPEGSLLDSGLLDSTAMCEIVSFIETQFNIQVEDEEIVPENFESIKDIVHFVNTKMAL